MKSTVYPDHPRASASFAYRHLLHCKRGDPYIGVGQSLLGFPRSMQSDAFPYVGASYKRQPTHLHSLLDYLYLPQKRKQPIESYLLDGYLRCNG